MGLFGFLSSAPDSVRLDWLQVEISTTCQAACTYCPHTAYRDQWRSQYMRQSVFSQLLPLMMQSRMLHLQGWGEPLLHPDFFPMLEQVKAAGCFTSITTNGTALTEDTLQRLVAARLDSIAFSLAGATAAENDRVRRGTSFEQIFQTIALLERIKQEHKSAVPDVRIAYLLLRSHLSSLETLVSRLVREGIRELTISPLSLVCTPELESESLAPIQEGDKKTIKSLRRKLFGLSLAAAFQGLNMHTHTIAAKPKRRCSENITRALVVDVNGRLMPCVFGALPVSGEVAHIFRGRTLPFVPRTFGLAAETDLHTFKNSSEYKSFLKEFPQEGHCPACWKRFVVTD